MLKVSINTSSKKNKFKNQQGGVETSYRINNNEKISVQTNFEIISNETEIFIKSKDFFNAMIYIFKNQQNKEITIEYSYNDGYNYKLNTKLTDINDNIIFNGIIDKISFQFIVSYKSIDLYKNKYYSIEITRLSDVGKVKLSKEEIIDNILLQLQELKSLK